MQAARVICVFASAERAQQALARLHDSGFDTAKLSIIARRRSLWSRPEHPRARMALAWVPFIGHIVAIGPAAAVLGRRPLHVPTGATALERMLTLCGMSPGEVRTYEAAVRGGQILLLLHGGKRDAARVRHVLHGGPQHAGLERRYASQPAAAPGRVAKAGPGIS